MANPFVALESTENTTTTEELPLLEEYAWDFNKNCYSKDVNGNLKTVYENEALKIWIYKMLKCERYRYNVYCHGAYNDICNYGVYLEEYIGKNPNNEKTAGMIKKEIREAILANPYIEKIDYLEIGEIKHEKLTLNLGITSIYGKLEMSGIYV